MADATDAPTPKRGFSSRWILDREHEPAGVQRASTRQLPSTLDTNGDGIPDTLAVRVDAQQPKRGAMRTIGAWLGRSVATLVFVAALVAAGVAATFAYNEHERAVDAAAALQVAEQALADTQDDLESVRGELADARTDASAGAADATALERERDELQLEVTVLRRMLLDAERRATKD